VAERETGRIEAFSDGVFAIAITLLVLTIQPPEAVEITSDRALLAALARLWPSFLAFVVSFVVILMIWTNHHDFFRLLQRADRPLLFADVHRKGGVGLGPGLERTERREDHRGAQATNRDERAPARTGCHLPLTNSRVTGSPVALQPREQRT